MCRQQGMGEARDEAIKCAAVTWEGTLVTGQDEECGLYSLDRLAPVRAWTVKRWQQRRANLRDMWVEDDSPALEERGAANVSSC